MTVTAVVGGIVAGAVLTWSAAASGGSPASSAALRGGQAAERAAGPGPSPSAAPAVPPVVVTGAPSGLTEKAGALEDAANGALLWSQGLTSELPMGSITKVMTALIVIEAGDLGREITVPSSVTAYVNQYGAASAGLVPGDVLTAQELLEALLLPSGCDAAYTLALAYGPGMPAFLAKMNATARQLGMLHTQFTSPDGLPYPTEYSTYSTPQDLMTLGRAAMAQPLFRSIVSQASYTLPAGNGHQAYSWANDNALIGSYPGADGIKTGFTSAAGQCLLFAATRGGLTLLGVVLGAPATGPSSSALQATKILNWGFSLPPRPSRPPQTPVPRARATVKSPS